MKEATEENVLQLPLSTHHNWINYLEDEFTKFEQLKNRGVRLRGSVIHFMLSFIGNLSTGDKAEFLELALFQASLNYPGLPNLKAHLEVVEKLLAAPELKPCFYVADAEVQTELEVVNSLGHTKRLDRLIINEKTKEVRIVDYKSGADVEGKYQEQVKEYIAILKELHPRYTVKGFLVYMDKLEVQEVKI